MVPLFGEIFDGVNAIWYYAEGDIVNGAFSSMSMIPIVGNVSTGAKWARNSLKWIKNGSDELWESASGLLYKITGDVNDRLGHVMEHARNIVEYPNGDPKIFMEFLMIQMILWEL